MRSANAPSWPVQVCGSHAIGAEAPGDVAHQRVASGLAHRICHLSGASCVAGGRTRVDDRTATAFDHDGQHCPCAEVEAARIHALGLVVDLQRKLEDVDIGVAVCHEGEIRVESVERAVTVESSVMRVGTLLEAHGPTSP